MSSSEHNPAEPAENPFLEGSLPVVFARTAAPIALVMVTSGLFNVVDAAFLGLYVGPEALAAVTLMFPIFMLINSMATLVSTGMSSILARRLGGGRMAEARQIFLGAHALSLLVSLALIALFFTLGRPLIDWISNGSEELAQLGWTYMAISIAVAPLSFLLSIHGDALRCQGQIALMTMVSITATLLNIAFNYVLIAQLGLGVAGSALGTALAQLFTLTWVFVYRSRERSGLSFPALRRQLAAGDGFRNRLHSGWSEMLALGAPHSLNLLGVSFGSTAVIYSIQVWSRLDYEATVGAYGIITRVMTFAYLPLMGVSLGFQTVLGNNYGAGLWERVDRSLRLALGVGLVYCASIQMALVLGRHRLADFFVEDSAIASEVARIVPMSSSMFWAFGVMMMFTSYFQAVGDAKRAALFGLTRTYAFSIPLTLLLPFAIGEVGIWFASPTAEVLMIALATYVFAGRARRRGLRYGMFLTAPAGALLTSYSNDLETPDPVVTVGSPLPDSPSDPAP